MIIRIPRYQRNLALCSGIFKIFEPFPFSRTWLSDLYTSISIVGSFKIQTLKISKSKNSLKSQEPEKRCLFLLGSCHLASGLPTFFFFPLNVKNWVRYFLSVKFLSHVWLFATPWISACQGFCPSPIPRACSNSCPSNEWCYSTISSSIVSFSSCPQSFPASGYFPVSQFFVSSGQSIGTSASASVLPMNIQGWFHLGLTGLISSQCKGLSRVFSSTIFTHSAFFIVQLSHP